MSMIYLLLLKYYFAIEIGHAKCPVLLLLKEHSSIPVSASQISYQIIQHTNFPFRICRYISNQKQFIFTF